MADPFSIAAGVIGVLAPSLHLIRLLRDDLRNISDASSTVKTLGQDVDSVEAALKSLSGISQAQWTALGPDVVKQSTGAIQDCTKTCEKFRADLQRWTRHSTTTISLRDRVKLGFFRQSEIKSLSQQLQKHQIALNLMISTANL